MNKKIVLSCRGLKKTFTEAGFNIEVLKNVDLDIQAAELVAIVGASGSGKSTLLQLLGGLDKPTQGKVLVSGTDIHQLSAHKQGLIRNQQLGFIYQFHHLLPEFDALENVCMPLLIQGIKPKCAQDKGRMILDKVGLSKRMKHRLGEMSGGERQRVAIARALITNPVCVLADEPTGNLDRGTAEQVTDLMLNLNQEFKTSFILVTHDLSLAKRMDRIFSLESGHLSPAMVMPTAVEA